MGVLGESNSRPLAPEARILPLDQIPIPTKTLHRPSEGMNEEFSPENLISKKEETFCISLRTKSPLFSTYEGDRPN
jgi:hypothetical protein